MRLPLTLAAVTAMTMSMAPPALGADGDNLPRGASAQAWSQYVKSVQEAEAVQDWTTPQGVLVADSGFRPFTDGFSFFNTSKPDSGNHALFGTPKSGPKNLDANTLRSMMGKRVCVEGSSEGLCTLTLAGKLWRDSTNENMNGGHCYGMASTAGQLFVGQLTPSEFQSGATSTYDLGLRTAISRQIARNMASQYSKSPVRYLAQPTEVVEDLKSALAPGKTPPVLIMFSKDGGHAVTPYALYQGENGRYDVAIYDNNYPDFRRVVRLDTANQTAQYAFQVNPEAPPVDPMLEGIGVVPTDFITGRQPCPFCTDAKHTTVQIDPVKSEVPLQAKVTTLKGRALMGLSVTPPTSPWEPGEPWNFPTFQLPKGKAFLLTVNARRSTKDIKIKVLATSGGYSIGAAGAKIPAGTKGRVGFDTTTGAVVYKSKDPGMGLLSFVDSGVTNSVAVEGRAESSNKKAAIGGALVGQRKVAVLYPLNRKAGNVGAVAQLQYYQNGKAKKQVAVVEAKLPAGSALALSYGKWTRANPKGLQAFVVSGSQRTPATVRFP